jgi:hypothetical protein
MTYGQQFEERQMFAPKATDSNRAKEMFESLGSHGANPKKLAQLLTVFDFTMSILGWNDVTLSKTVTSYQASIDTRYHDDYKAVATIEELDYRLAKRRSNRQGLMGNNQNNE